METNECNSYPCSHGGTCIDLYDGYTCLCTPGWEGTECSEDVNECIEYAGTDLGCQVNYKFSLFISYVCRPTDKSAKILM